MVWPFLKTSKKIYKIWLPTLSFMFSKWFTKGTGDINPEFDDFRILWCIVFWLWIFVTSNNLCTMRIWQQFTFCKTEYKFKGDFVVKFLKALLPPEKMFKCLKLTTPVIIYFSKYDQIMAFQFLDRGHGRNCSCSIAQIRKIQVYWNQFESIVDFFYWRSPSSFISGRPF